MWKRTNKIFLHDIRKQLLIWRSLDDEGHTSYRIVLQEALGHQDPLPAGQTG